jgi:lysozyme
MLSISCLAAGLFGVLMGYVFAWSTRRNEPNAIDVAGLIATIAGGTVVSSLSELNCPERLSLYLIGMVVGYLVYLIVLKLNYREIEAAYKRGELAPSPFFPWLVRSKQNAPNAPVYMPPTTPPANNCGCCEEAQPRRRCPEIDAPIEDAAAQVGGPVGIDVSRWQGKVDWAKVRQAGYTFAFVKATESAHWVDPNFVRNREEARKAGLYVGAYHFFRPKVMVEAQVLNFVRNIGSLRPGELPPVLDIEVPEDWKGIPQEERISMILHWLREVELRLGVKPIVYLSPSFAADILKHDKRLMDYMLWIAHYTGASQPRVPAPWTHWWFWQHSETGSVPGITGHVDLNRFNGREEDLGHLARRTAEKAEKAPGYVSPQWRRR